MEKRTDLNQNDGRTALLKDYIERLTKGEDLETVRAEFKQNFTGISAAEIAKAEQQLLQAGTPLHDVQRLCDVHSALFHGATDAERIAAAEREVQLEQVMDSFDERTVDAVRTLVAQQGHPLQVLTLENHAILRLTEQIGQQQKTGGSQNVLAQQLRQLAEIAKHYGKKDELMFPLLKDRYGYNGPADVMWGVEDEIRDSLRRLQASPETADGEGMNRSEMLQTMLKRIREMIYKEENILFPLCTENFTEDEWIAIAKDMPLFGACLIPALPVWEKARQAAMQQKTEPGFSDKTVQLPGGSIRIDQLRAMLNTLPMEITLIDEEDHNRFFNEGEKLFTRPAMAIGRPVYSCHPKRVEPMVRMLIHDFKTGKRDEVHILSEKAGRQVLIHYFALRAEDGTYLGTMEAVQEMDGIAAAIRSGKKGPVEL